MDRSIIESSISSLKTHIANGKAQIAKWEQELAWFENGLTIFGGEDVIPPAPIWDGEQHHDNDEQQERIGGGLGRGQSVGGWSRQNPMPLEVVRDAVVALHKNPVHHDDAQTAGSILISDVAKKVGCTDNSRLREHLKTLVDRDILRTEPYKNGVQYFYIPPRQSGLPPARTPDGQQLRDGSAPIPGTGRNSQVTSSGSKDYEQILRRVDRSKFDVEYTGGGHIRVTNKTTRASTVMSSTPSSPGTERVVSDLRRIGVSL